RPGSDDHPPAGADARRRHSCGQRTRRRFNLLVHAAGVRAGKRRSLREYDCKGGGELMSKYFTGVVCLECGHEMAPEGMASACPQCGSQWLDARYDYEAVARLWPSALANRERSLWRYAELLPLLRPDPEITLGEGFTPLVRLYQYERLYDHPHLYIKDE